MEEEIDLKIELGLRKHQIEAIEASKKKGGKELLYMFCGVFLFF